MGQFRKRRPKAESPRIPGVPWVPLVRSAMFPNTPRADCDDDEKMGATDANNVVVKDNLVANQQMNILNSNKNITNSIKNMNVSKDKASGKIKQSPKSVWTWGQVSADNQKAKEAMQMDIDD